jgi:hypothetical protein
MRVLFQHALSQNEFLAEELLDQINSHAHEASETGQPYPAIELEWVSTTAFNHAINFYSLGQDNACKRWAAKAIVAASICPDSGVLQGLLESKLAGLNWDAN